MKHLLVFLIAVILFIVLLYFYRSVEPFFDFGSRIDCPTRNQSYDLRGDIYTIPYKMDFAWLNSEIGPTEPNRCPQRRLMEVETMTMTMT